MPSTLASAALLANLKTPRERALAKMRQKLVESRMHATAAGFDGGGGGGEGGEAGAGDIDAEAVALVTGHALGGRYERWVGSVSVWGRSGCEQRIGLGEECVYLGGCRSVRTCVCAVCVCVRGCALCVCACMYLGARVSHVASILCEHPVFACLCN